MNLKIKKHFKKPIFAGIVILALILGLLFSRPQTDIETNLPKSDCRTLGCLKDKHCAGDGRLPETFSCVLTVLPNVTSYQRGEKIVVVKEDTLYKGKIITALIYFVDSNPDRPPEYNTVFNKCADDDFISADQNCYVGLFVRHREIKEGLGCCFGLPAGY